MPTEEQLYNTIGINAFGMMLLPFMYGPALNRDFCDAYYNSYLDNGGNINELLMFYDTNNIDVENIDVEAFCELPRQWILSDFFEEPLLDGVSPVIKKIFDSDMDMRNIIISTEVLYENPNTGETETYPTGEFKYLGNENKFYTHVCDINGDCTNIFNPDEEWIHLDNISTIFENELE